jgi:hypothetical protein
VVFRRPYLEGIPLFCQSIFNFTSDVKKKVLGPLGEEAAIATTGRMVFTRHRAIANSAIWILSENFDVDSEYLFINLVQKALQAHAQGTFVPCLGNWNYLSDHFFDQGNESLGVRLAQAILDVEPTNPYLIVKLAQLYRKAEQPEQSVQVFRSTSNIDRTPRGYYYEWGTSEGYCGYYALGIWLSAFSLADQANRQPPDIETTKLVMTGMTIAFAELFERYNSPTFIKSCGAAAQLGLIIEKDPKGISWLQSSQNRAREEGVEDVSPNIAIERFQTGVAQAWEQREDDLPDWITSGNKLTFSGLAGLLKIG